MIYRFSYRFSSASPSALHIRVEDTTSHIQAATLNLSQNPPTKNKVAKDPKKEKVEYTKTDSLCLYKNLRTFAEKFRASVALLKLFFIPLPL